MSQDTFKTYTNIMNKLDDVLDLVDVIDPRSIPMAQLNDIREYADMLNQRVSALMQKLGHLDIQPKRSRR